MTAANIIALSLLLLCSFTRAALAPLPSVNSTVDMDESLATLAHSIDSATALVSLANSILSAGTPLASDKINRLNAFVQAVVSMHRPCEISINAVETASTAQSLEDAYRKLIPAMRYLEGHAPMVLRVCAHLTIEPRFSTAPTGLPDPYSPTQYQSCTIHHFLLVSSLAALLLQAKPMDAAHIDCTRLVFIFIRQIIESFFHSMSLQDQPHIKSTDLDVLNRLYQVKADSKHVAHIGILLQVLDSLMTNLQKCGTEAAVLVRHGHQTMALFDRKMIQIHASSAILAQSHRLRNHIESFPDTPPSNATLPELQTHMLAFTQYLHDLERFHFALAIEWHAFRTRDKIGHLAYIAKVTELRHRADRAHEHAILHMDALMHARLGM